MAGLNSVLGIARDALAAQSYGLSITSQNVTNVNTPGYARRTVQLETWENGNPADGSVRIGTTQRNVDQFILRRVFETNGYMQASSEREQGLGRIESLFMDTTGTGLQSSIQALFSSFQTLSSSPADPTARAQVLSRADELAAAFQQTAGSISDLRQDLLSKAQGVGQEVTDLAAKLASLNTQIATAEATGEPALDLRDQQEQLVSELSDKVDVNSFRDKSGGLVVLTGGVALVEGGNAAHIDVSQVSGGLLAISVVRPGGTSIDIAAKLQGGTLAGIRQARDIDAVASVARLDQMVSDIATAVNTTHAAGVGLDGSTGNPLFALMSPPGSAASISVSAVMAGHPERLAASSTSGALPGGSDNAAALAMLASSAVCSGGTRTPAECYSDLVGYVGGIKASAQRDTDVRSAMQGQLDTMRQSVSGVSLDEEMVSLSQFERAYQAAGKLIQTVDTLLDNLMKTI